MATRTEVSGNVYDALGNLVLIGLVTVTLQQDIRSVDGTKVAPFKVTVDLSGTSGVFDKFLYATVGATPAGVYYQVEFDPDPNDTTKPAKQKDGYWRNRWAVPNTALVHFNSFPVL
jgi:hypothetical protein